MCVGVGWGGELFASPPGCGLRIPPGHVIGEVGLWQNLSAQRKHGE